MKDANTSLEYGDCGVGAFCLGGCDPRLSYSLDSCMPAPVCEDRKMKFDKMDKDLVLIDKYYGDESKADWVYQGEPAPFKGNALLTMPKDSPGTVLASTTYMWYGNVKARMKTSRGRGVVTAFILLSDVKDEIDYEWVGVDLETSQTNYYFQGIKNYENSDNITMSDSFDNFHDYEIRWTPDKIEWLIDGKTHRTKERKDTWNSTTNSWEFPQTPARVQLSVWPGGQASNAKGTIDWAGGLIDWNHPDIKNNGYFYATVEEVTIECYDTKKGPGSHNNLGYYFNDIKATNDTVVDGKKSPIIASSQATGLDPDKGKKSDKNKKPTVPGGTSTGQDHSDDTDENNDSDGSSGGGSGDVSPSNCDPTSFNQKCGADPDAAGSGNAGGRSGSSKASASILAVIIAGSALLLL